MKRHRERNKGRKSSEEIRRIGHILDRNCTTSDQCSICGEQNARFKLPDRLAEGLLGPCVCSECHGKIMEAQEALKRLRAGAQVNDKQAVHHGIATFRTLKKIPLALIEDAIDAIRNSLHEESLLVFKDQLVVLLLQHHGDSLNCVVRRDRYLPEMAKITWHRENRHWVCHMPVEKLWGRFREMVLAS